jgi:methylenetetrahydrofolate dehydrogenase (NADP+) / methenyltetrahydrofolate cyclohydrolase
MKILSGKKEAKKILAGIQKGIKKAKIKPFLAVVLIGEDKASEIYVKLKKEAARKVGIEFQLHKFSEDASQIEIESKIADLNEDKKVNGIIVQLPVPKGFNTQKIISAIAPKKDADGFSNKSGKIIPVFPTAIIRLIESAKKNISGKKAIVIANSKTFGETMCRMLQLKKVKADYILLKDFKDKFKNIKNYSIVITAVGVPGIVTGLVLKKGAIVIDGGITKENGKTLGDVDFQSAKKVAGFISPVPGGVGPMTVAGLLENVYLAALNKIDKK